MKRRGLRPRRAGRKGEERSKVLTRLSGRSLWLWRLWRETPGTPEAAGWERDVSSLTSVLSYHSQGKKAEVVSRGERELRQKQRLRGRKKSLVEDYSDQPSESDLSDLFGFGLAPDDGSTRSRGNPAQGETAVLSSYHVVSSQILRVKPLLS